MALYRGDHARSLDELASELALTRVVRAAANGPDEPEATMERASTAVRHAFGLQRSLVALHLEATGEVVPFSSHRVRGLEGLKRRRTPLPPSPLFRRAREERRAVFVEDVRVDGLVAQRLAAALGLHSVVVVPLLRGERCVGFFAADRGSRPFSLEQDALDVLTAMGEIVAIFLEKALEQAELRRVNELKSQFIAHASHELRTPAAIVCGIASTFRFRGEDLTPAQLTQLHEALNDQSERMRRLVDQLLDLSRLEAKATEIRPERVDVRARLEQLVADVAPERAGEVGLDVPEAMSAVVDPDAFDQIVSNLITNAFRYGRPPVTIAARELDGHFRVTVEDRGDGVAAEFVPRLFERFSRSETTLHSPSGSGLGLSIARSYALAHGGNLVYEGATPHGARFEFVLPRLPL